MRMTKKARKRKKKLQMRNKRLIKEYYWLLPRNVWTGKPLKNYDYTFIEWGWSEGWDKAFGMMYLKELGDEIKRIGQKNFMILQQKEKFGSCRNYVNGTSREAHDIIDKYEALSQNICYFCGRPDTPMTTLDKEIPQSAKNAVFVFLGALAIIVFFAIFQSALPSWDGKPLKMNLVIQIVMIAAAALMILFCKAQPKKAVAGPVWQSGMVAVVAIYGIAWMADTYFSNYMPEIQAMLEGIVKDYPWSIALVFFMVSVLINSQGAVVVSMLPLAYSLGIAGPVLLGVLPSVYGYFFIPNYPSDIATVNFDRSGTTVIGKYLLNHSFMMPGLICVFTSTIVAYILSSIIF